MPLAFMSLEWGFWKVSSDKKYKLVQFRVSVHDELLTHIINKLEEEAGDRRGYVANKIQEMIKDLHLLKELAGESDVTKIADMIKAYKTLSELAGESDPYKIILTLAQRQQASAPAPSVQQADPEPPKPARRRVNVKKYEF